MKISIKLSEVSRRECGLNNRKGGAALDEFSVYHKILSICENIMDIRKKLSSLTDEETKLAVYLLERLKNDLENKNVKRSKF